jgi:DNA-binding CsgD family transcriptional regulator
VSALVFKRASTDPPFSVEEREILHLFRSESDWMFRPPVTTEPSPGLAGGLTRREQDTLSLLLTDASEKEMAARLGISPHTVHDYVKRLYRKLGVTSRAALMAASAQSRWGTLEGSPMPPRGVPG